MEELNKASVLEPLPADLVAGRDFPAPSQSDIRLLSTSSVPPTSTQLYRSYDFYTKKLGAELGAKKCCLANDFAPDSNPHVVIESILQNQHEWFYDLVKVENESYDSSFIRPPPSKPVRFTPSSDQRQAAPVTLASVVTGSGSREEALRASGCGHTVMVAEQQPTLLALLKERPPP